MPELQVFLLSKEGITSFCCMVNVEASGGFEKESKGFYSDSIQTDGRTVNVNSKLKFWTYTKSIKKSLSFKVNKF